MPKDGFKRERAQWQRHTIESARDLEFLTSPFRKCPSCKQEKMSIKKLETKVVVHCVNCFLEYVFTRFPAFEDIDYYNKTLDQFRQDVKNGRTSPAAIAPPEKTAGKCPTCNDGQLAIVRLGEGRHFVKCSNSKCHAAFSLPYKGDFEPAKEACKKCGWPLLFWVFRSRAFALFCFNPNCGFRSEWRRYA